MNTKILGVLVSVGVLVIGVVLINNWTKVSEEIGPQNSEVEEFKSKEPEIESPTNAYMEYYRALNAEDMKKVKKYLAKSIVEQLEQSGMKDEELEMIKSLVPKEVKIIDEEIENNSAILTATGGFGSQEGIIEMIKEDGKWKLLKENWELTEGHPLSSGKIDIAAIDILFNQKEKDKADLKVIVKNNGEGDISKMTYRFSINEAEEEMILFPADVVNLDNLSSGEELELDFSHAYSNYYNHYYKYKSDGEKQKPFELKMVLVLDLNDELKEFNEENNKITKIFYLQD